MASLPRRSLHAPYVPGRISVIHLPLNSFGFWSNPGRITRHEEFPNSCVARLLGRPSGNDAARPSVKDYLQEFGRAGRDGKPSLALLFTNGQQDKRVLEFMAKLNGDEARLDDDQKQSVLKGKLSQIQDMNDLALNRHHCFRRGISRYFHEEKPATRRSQALRIVEWLFAKRDKPTKVKYCCDTCDAVTAANYMEWVRSVFR